MATVYGSTTNHWRAYMTYTTSQTSTTYSVPVSAAGMQSVAWGFSINSGITVTLAATGSNSSVWTGGFSSPSGSTTSKSFGSRTFTWSRGKSAATKTVTITVTNSSGYMNGTSSKSISVTVPALDSYTITFNANGGSGGPSSQTKWYGEDLTLSTSKPTRTGHTFLGWSTSSSASTATWTAGGTYTANSAATLYAVWKANTYTISYNANGGSGAPASQTKTYGVNLTLRSTAPTRTGYTCLGWSTNSSATTASYSLGGTYTANSAATLYAVWKANTYTVSYNANSGSGAPASQTKTYGVTLTLSSTIPTRTNYDFVGWSTSSSATSATYQAGGSYTANSAATLYAVWKLSYWTPNITDLSAVRCDSNGDADDEGTYVLVTCSWEVCTTITNVGSTASLQQKSGSSWTTVGSAVSLSGTSGTISMVRGTFSTDSSYALRIVVEDTHGGVSTSQTILSQAFFTLDFMAGGHGVGIGVPATEEDTLRVGMDFHALGDASIDGNVSAANIGAPSLIVDMDALTTSGIYYISASSTNIPLASYPGQCVVANSGNGYIVQLFTVTAAAPVIYARRMNTSGWGSWARIAEERHMTYGAGQDAYIQNQGGTNQLWGISSICTNANNTTYYDERMVLLVTGAGVSLYQAVTGTPTVWTLEGVATETDITPTNCTATTLAVRRARPTCTLYINALKLSSALANGSTVAIGTIPSGYRPAHVTNIPIMGNSDAAGKGLYIYINSSGVMTLYNRSGASIPNTINLYACCTYVL